MALGLTEVPPLLCSRHTQASVLVPALRTVGNIVTGDDNQTQIVINCNALPYLLNLLTTSPKKSIKKEACWTISNITAGNAEQIKAVIDANVIPALVQILKTAEYKTQKEACWAISNASSGGLAQPEIIRYLIAQDCIKPLCDLLAIADNRIIEVSLDALENFLKVGEKDKEARGLAINETADLIEKAGGMEKIFNCQQNQNDKIYSKAFNIIETYFGEDDEAIDETMAPETSGNTFGFGSNVNQQFNFN